MVNSCFFLISSLRFFYPVFCWPYFDVFFLSSSWCYLLLFFIFDYSFYLLYLEAGMMIMMITEGTGMEDDEELRERWMCRGGVVKYSILLDEEGESTKGRLGSYLIYQFCFWVRTWLRVEINWVSKVGKRVRALILSWGKMVKVCVDMHWFSPYLEFLDRRGNGSLWSSSTCTTVSVLWELKHDGISLGKT